MGRNGNLVRSPVHRRSMGRLDGRPLARHPALALADPMARPRPIRDWHRGPGLVLRPLRPGRPRHPKPDGAARGPCHNRAVRVDAESDRDVARRGTHRIVCLPRFRVRGGNRRPARRAGSPRDAPRGADPRGPIRRRLPRVRGPRAPLAPAAAPSSQMNGDARARVRSARGGPQILQVHDVDHHAREVATQPLDVALADHRDDVALRLRELPEHRGHERVPIVNQDALRRRELPRELLDEPRLVRVEPLELCLDLLLPGEESAERGSQEAHPLPERHLPPHAAEHGAGVLVDQRDLAPDFLRGPRGRDHLVADLDAVLPRDPDLELREQGEGPRARGSRLINAWYRAGSSSRATTRGRRARISARIAGPMSKTWPTPRRMIIRCDGTPPNYNGLWPPIPLNVIRPVKIFARTSAMYWTWALSFAQ